MVKVSVQLQSQQEVSFCPGQQGASAVTDDRAGGWIMEWMDAETYWFWDAGEMCWGLGYGWGSACCSFKASLKLLCSPKGGCVMGEGTDYPLPTLCRRCCSPALVCWRQKKTPEKKNKKTKTHLRSLLKTDVCLSPPSLQIPQNCGTKMSMQRIWRTFIFPLEFWEERGKLSFSSLSLKEGHKTWNAREGSHRSKAICTHPNPFLPFSFVSCSFSFW